METYYYVDGNRQQAGPYDLETLVERGITESTLVWKQGMADWQPARKVPEVADALRAAASRAAAAVPSVPPSAPQAEPAVPQPAAPVPPAEPAAPQPVPPETAEAGEERAKDYLVWSILSTIFCVGGFSLSVAGIVMSALTRSFNARGNFRQARLFSKLAFCFTIIGTLVGFLYYFIIFVAILADM